MYMLILQVLILKVLLSEELCMMVMACVQVSLRMKHDYHNIISATAASAASPNDNIVWLEHLIHIDLSSQQSL